MTKRNRHPPPPHRGLLSGLLPATILLAIFAPLAACSPSGPETRIAVASNFQAAMRDLARRFETTGGRSVSLSFGSTGKQYAQIVHGAPFAAFFAADAERPRRLEEDDLAVEGSRFTYAVGRLVLWSPEPGYVDPQGKILEHGRFRHLAVAQPKLAPYGEAARQVLVARGLWNRLEGRLVRGENVAQAYQYVASGNAELGFVAYAQIALDDAPKGSFWEVPQTLYSPIEQQAVLLKENEAARKFLAFVASEEGRAIVRAHGYATP